MKKLNYLLLAVMSILFAASCSQDETLSVESGDASTVTFTVDVPESGPQSRAIGDGTQATQLFYAVYDLEGMLITKKDETASYPHTVSISLAKDQEYQIAFWAQDPTCTAYTTTDLKNVTIDYTKVKNNDESLDAFFHSQKFTVDGSTIPVTLTRPFAQLNVGTADYDKASTTGLKIKYSEVSIKQAASKINLLTGVTSDPVDVVYTSNAIPSDTEVLNVNSVSYRYLSMSYILVNGDKDNVTLEYKFSTEAEGAGKTVDFKSGLTDVPVRSNYRTNIVGNLLTENADFDISIDDDFGGDIIYPVGSLAQELENAATFGGTVTLTEDVTLTEPLTVGADMVLNIEEGKTLTGSLKLLNGAHLTVNGGAINNTDDTTSGIVSNGILTLNDVEITSARHALRIESGNVVIYGGTYKVAPTSKKTLYALNVGDAGTVANVTIKGGTFIGPKGTDADSGSAVGVKVGSSVTIEGGNFSGGKNNTLYSKGTLNVVGGTFDQNPSNWVADGYKTVQSGSNFVVVSNDIDAVVSSAEELSDAIANGSENIVLTEGNYILPSVKNKDITITGTEDVIITISQPNYSGANLTLSGVTVKGSGYATGVQHVNTVTYKDVKIVGDMCLYGEEVKFENCSFELNNQYIWTYGAKKVSFDKCRFNTTGKAILIYNEGANLNSNVTVTDCTFNATEGGKAGAIANQNCAAIEIDSTHGASFTLTTSSNSINKDYFSGTWRIKACNAKVTVNGTEYSTIAIDGQTMTIDTDKNVTVNN